MAAGGQGLIVVDVMVPAYLLLPVADATFEEQARRLLEREPRWVAPNLWVSEFLNICAGHLRAGRMTFDEAVKAVDAAERLIVTLPIDPGPVMELVSTSRCSAYDLAYVAAARELGVPLVTGDRQVLAEFPGVAVTPAAWLERAG
ncbi:type II toxin-antitoxin system VapC family toxin [Tepidiforma sp.]|uniref:type II toxin-antitoxin system VapC family toxin n=1 Tax=Tepidiforma sp. TaxID=2682230 RepID=UPI002626CD89|nr:type II toxin-antitoxin system VapC family toxin [Tepidiforma sp.]MCX7618934.1 type II toxin-antitoxin system VapC family toxin [Tepidiforma sp.]